MAHCSRPGRRFACRYTEVSTSRGSPWLAAAPLPADVQGCTLCWNHHDALVCMPGSRGLCCVQKWRAVQICTYIQCRKKIYVRVREDLAAAVQKMLQQKEVCDRASWLFLKPMGCSVADQMLGPPACVGRHRRARASPGVATVWLLGGTPQSMTWGATQ